MIALANGFSHLGYIARSADGEWRHSASFDANGGERLRQELTRRLLFNRQRPFDWGLELRISPRPVRVRRRASPGRGNAPGKTIGRSVRKTAGRYDRRVHPRAKLPDRVVPWVLRLLRSWHPPLNENRFGREGSPAGAFHYAGFVHPP